MSDFSSTPDRGLKIRKFTREAAVVTCILAVFFYYAGMGWLAIICLVVAGIVALVGEYIGGGTAGPRREEVTGDFPRRRKRRPRRVE